VAAQDDVVMTVADESSDGFFDIDLNKGMAANGLGLEFSWQDGGTGPLVTLPIWWQDMFTLVPTWADITYDPNTEKVEFILKPALLDFFFSLSAGTDLTVTIQAVDSDGSVAAQTGVYRR